jgi:hypothetical protein
MIDAHVWMRRREARGVTLVLGACVADAVILGADTRTQVLTFNSAHELMATNTLTEAKISSMGRSGVATYGTGPPNVRVHEVIAAEARPEWDASKVIDFLKSRFDGVPRWVRS